MDRWQRRRRKLYLALNALVQKIRDQTLADPAKYPELFEQQMMLRWIGDRPDGDDAVHIHLIYQMLRRGYKWQDVSSRPSEGDQERIKRSFYRWIKNIREQ